MLFNQNNEFTNDRTYSIKSDLHSDVEEDQSAHYKFGCANNKDSMMTHGLIIFGDQANVKATLNGQFFFHSTIASLFGAIYLCIEMIRIKLETRFT